MISGSLIKVVLLLSVSNAFMLTAWYFHLRQWHDRSWYVAAFLSWGIAFFEYAVHIPANRLGNTVLSLPQLQILQVGLSLLFFMPFAALVMRRPVSLDYFFATACLMGAAFFIFRGKGVEPRPALAVQSEAHAEEEQAWTPVAAKDAETGPGRVGGRGIP